MTNLSSFKSNEQAIWLAGDLKKTIHDYFSLLKPRVMSLVVFTAGCGILMAPGPVKIFTACLALFCIAVGAGAAGCLNMWYDRDIDKLMLRTRNRPLPQERLQPQKALIFGVTLAITAVAIMGVGVSIAAAGYLGFSIFFYAVVYTIWLKRWTVHNIVIGGAAGSFPPLIGWVSVTGHASLEAWILFAIIFMWTPPHFWALALYRHDDYRQAKVPMLPVVKGLKSTKDYIIFYTVGMILTTFLPYIIGMGSWIYLVLASGLGGIFLALAVLVWQRSNPSYSIKLFAYSIVYLFLLFLGLTLDRLFIL